MKHMNPTALVILDGFGYSEEKKYNAVAHAHMPYFNSWWKQYSHAFLQASGKAVGLCEGMMGNSEVGHLTIGAGCIIDQPMKLWLDSIDDGAFFHHAVLRAQLEKLRAVGGYLHILGLLSDAGVHGHEACVQAVIDVAVKVGIKKIVIHAILDGRDVSPQSAYEHMHQLTKITKQYNNGQVIIGSMHGRFYAMDRDNNWDRIEKSYRVLTESFDQPSPRLRQAQSAIASAEAGRLRMIGDGSYESWEKVLERYYAQSITDEFIPPTQLNDNAIIRNGDGIIFCNVRPDRARELTSAFVQPKRVPFTVKPLNLTFFITPIDYGSNLKTTVLFSRDVVRSTLKDILAEHHKTIFTIAETEKYAHVTYFFRGENEEPVATEMRTMAHSLKVKNYALCPEMSAGKITHIVLDFLRNQPADFYLINYANADMVGHSGNFGATIQALEFLDKQLGILYEHIVEKMNGTLYITGDHGKAEDMFDEVLGQPHTAHTTNLVPFLMIKKGREMNGALPLQQLSDISPFILENMGIEVPIEMKKKD